MNVFKNVIFYIILSFVFIACSDDKEQNVESKIEKYEFVELKNIARDSKQISNIQDSKTDSKTDSKIDSNNIKKITITLPKEFSNKDSMQLHLDFKNLDSNNLKDKPKIIAFFPKECKHCIDILPHINNLATTHKNTAIIALNQSGSSINDGTFLRQINFLNLLEANNSFSLLLDSIKRKLNVEIRDFNAPVFFILDKQDFLLKSIEGLVTQEMLEFEIQNLDSKDSKK